MAKYTELGDMVKIFASAAIIACLVLTGINVFMQREICHYRWVDVDPFQVQRCEPVGLIRSEMEQYRRLASDTR